MAEKFEYGLNNPEASESEAERIKRIKAECEQVSWVVNGDHVPFQWHDGKDPRIQGWFWNFGEDQGKLGKIYGDENDVVNYPDGYAQAISLHEHSHTEIAYPREVWTEEELQTPGLLISDNWVEDNPTENFGIQAHGKGEEWFKLKAKLDTATGGRLDPKIKETVEQGIGYIPDYMLLGAKTRHYFYQREVTGELNINGETGQNAQIDPQKLQAFLDDPAYPKVVREKFKKLVADGTLDTFNWTIPSPWSTDEQKKQAAQMRADLFKDKIWPEFQDIYEADKQEHNINDFIKQLIDGQQFAGQGQGGQVIVIDISSFPPEIQDELKKMAEEQQQQGQSGQGQGESGSEAGESGQGQSGQGQAGAGSPGGESQPGAQGGSPGQPGEAGQPGGAGQPSGESQSGGAGQPGTEGQPSPGGASEKTSPKQQLSKEAQESIEAAYDALSDEAKAKLEQEAQQQWGKVEDQVNQEMQAKTDAEGKTVQTEFGKPQDGDSPEGGEGGESGQDGSDSGGESQPSSGPPAPKDGSGGGQGQGGAHQPDNSEISQEVTSPQISKAPPKPYHAPEYDENELMGDINQKIDQFETEMEFSIPPQDRTDYLSKVRPDVARKFAQEYQNFEQAHPEMEDISDRLAEDLWEALRPDKKPKHRYSRKRGDLSIKRYVREGYKGGLKIWSREEKPQETDVSITYLLDMSGSTLGIGDELGGAIDTDTYTGFGRTILGSDLQLVGSALRAQLEMRVKSEVQAYPARDGVMGVFVDSKVFLDSAGNDYLSDEIKAGLWGIVQESGGGTPTAQAIIESYQKIKADIEANPELERDVNFIVVLTDGQPDTGPGAVVAAMEAVYRDADANNSNFVILVMGIGRGTEFVGDIAPLLPSDLRDQMAERLGDLRGQDIDPDTVIPSFRTVTEAAAVFPLIVDKMLRRPRDFRRQLDEE